MIKSFLYHPFVLLLAICLIVYTQSKAQLYIKAKSITEKEGLSDKRVTCFYKDKTGFIWIGTKNGLNRYDGHSFKVYRPAEGNSISNEVINDIAEDSKGRIWVATMEGLNYYDPVQNHWECLIPQTKTPDNDIPSYIIWDIQVDKYDKVWIASDVYEFSCYDPVAKKFTYYDWRGFVLNNKNFIKENYNSIKKFVSRSEHEFWLASNTGLVSLDTRKKEFQYIGGGYRSEVLDLQYDADAKKIFVSTEKGNLFLYDEAKAIYSKVLSQPEPYPSAHILSPGNNELWMASENGLLKISDDRKRINVAKHIPQLTGSLQPGGVSAVLKDNTGVRWVGTSNGISVYDQSIQSTAFLPLQNVSDKASINNISCVYFDDTTNAYFVCATEPNAVFIIHTTTGQIKKITTDAAGSPLSSCNIIKADNDKNIWLLTGNNVYRYNRKTEQFSLFPMPNKGEEIMFRAMAQDAEGNYWFGSFHNGLYYYLTKEKKFSHPVGEYFKYMPTVTSLCSDKKRNAVWIGTFSVGFYYYDLAAKKLTKYVESDKTPDYAALNLVQDIALDPMNNVWIATHAGGIFRYNDGQPYEKAFTRFDIKKGLSNNSYISLSGNGDSIMWLLSGKGISAINTSGRFLYDVNDEQFFNFSSFSSEVRHPHKIFYNPGKKELLVGAGGGLLFHPVGNNKLQQHFPVTVTRITVNGKEISEAERLKNSFRQIPFQFNSVSFDFAPLYYGAASGLVCEYMLEGYDKSWINAGKKFSAAYQNLPPRNYLFQVRVKDAGGHIAGSSTAFSFRIVPPFWQTWWFITLAALLLAMLIYLLFKRRIATIKNKAAIKQQMAELEAKALRAQMNPHFIFNSLNAIQECIVTEKTDAAFEYLSKFSRLLRLVLNNSEKNFISLSSELEMIRLYLSLESLRFRQSFNYYIEVAEAIDTDEIQVPSLLIQPFVENAVWHGLRMKEGEKKLWIRFMTTDQHLLIEIEDNGIGREKAAAIKKQKLGVEQFESKGTALSQQRLNLLNRQGIIRARVETIDLVNSAQQSTGTKIIIQLPFDTQKLSQSKPFEHAKNTDR